MVVAPALVPVSETSFGIEYSVHGVLSCQKTLAALPNYHRLLVTFFQ